MSRIIVFLSLVCFSSSSFSQQKYVLRSIAFYNLENLFDSIDDPNKMDEHSPILKISKTKRKLVYHEKIKALAEVISALKPKPLYELPSIIGLAELENINVLKDLLNTKKLKHYSYKIIHEDSPDPRGIDVALIYKAQHFRPVSYHLTPVKIWNALGQRIYTRSVLVVLGYFDQQLSAFIVCHWPSRRGGQSKSNIFREKAAYTVKHIIDSLNQNHPNLPILIMGDFNDNPTNSSFKTVLKSQKIKSKANDSTLFNPFEKLFYKGYASLGFRDEGHLFDQILINKNWTTKSNKHFFFVRAGIFNPPFLTIQKGKFKGYPLRSFNRNVFTGGYSDHYPVFIILAKQVF